MHLPIHEVFNLQTHDDSHNWPDRPWFFKDYKVKYKKKQICFCTKLNIIQPCSSNKKEAL